MAIVRYYQLDFVAACPCEGIETSTAAGVIVICVVAACPCEGIETTLCVVGRPSITSQLARVRALKLDFLLEALRGAKSQLARVRALKRRRYCQHLTCGIVAVRPCESIKISTPNSPTTSPKSGKNCSGRSSRSWN